jgi:hypothetical protein
MKNNTTNTAQRAIIARFRCLLRGTGCLLLCLAGSLAASAQPFTIVKLISADHEVSPPVVKFKVSWADGSRNEQHRTKVWLFVDYRRMKDDVYEADMLHADIAEKPTTTSGTVTLEPGNNKGFWLEGPPTGEFEATVTVPLTVTLAGYAKQFGWCGVAIDRPPFAEPKQGGYELHGTPPFIIQTQPGNSASTVSQTSTAYDNCIYGLTDKTGCPGELPLIPEITGFTATDTEVCAGQDVTLTATANNAERYSFDNGVTWDASAATVVYPAAATTNTYTLKATRADGGCTVTFSDTKTVTGRPNFSAGAISTTGSTICYGASPGTISSAGSASGGNGAITYEWRRNNSPISGTNAATFTPTDYNTTVGAQTFTRWAKDGACSTTFVQSAGSWVMTVRPNFTAGSISTTGSTICYGASPGAISSTALASGGNGVITYEWRRNNSPISGTNVASYTPTVYNTTAGAQTFTRWAKDGACSTTFVQSAGSWVMTVRSNFTASISGSASNTCPASTVALNATASGASTFLWYKNGSLVQNGTTASYTATTTGSYTVRGRDANDCYGSPSAQKLITIKDCRIIESCGLTVYSATASSEGTGTFSTKWDPCNDRSAKLPSTDEMLCLCNHFRANGWPKLAVTAAYWVEGAYGGNNGTVVRVNADSCTSESRAGGETHYIRCVEY